MVNDIDRLLYVVCYAPRAGKLRYAAPCLSLSVISSFPSPFPICQ